MMLRPTDSVDYGNGSSEERVTSLEGRSLMLMMIHCGVPRNGHRARTFSATVGARLLVALCFVGALAAAEPAAADDGLMAYYAFDGDVRDSGPAGMHGQVMGDASFAEGRVGQCLYLDGDGDYVDLGESLNLPTEYSVCAWIRPDRVDRWFAAILAKYEVFQYGPYAFALHYDRANAWISDGRAGYRDVNTRSAIGAARWTHVAFIGRGEEMRIYIDGELDVVGAVPRMTTGSDRVTVGRQVYFDSSWRYRFTDVEFAGRIDELRIYGRALTASEVGGLVAAASSTQGRATLVGQTLGPDSIVFAGERFESVWTFRNDGETSWDRSYRWRSQSADGGETTSEQASYALVRDVPPGDEYPLAIWCMAASASDERLSEVWQLTDAGGAVVDGATAVLDVGVVECAFADGFEAPVGYPIRNVKRQAYVVESDFLDRGYDEYGWHPSEDWNGKANGGGDHDKGDPVYAVANGYVVAALNDGMRPLLIRHVVRDASGECTPLYSRYIHMDSTLVERGAVRRGQRVGTIGKWASDGTESFLAHLDFGILKGDVFLPVVWSERAGGYAQQREPPTYHDVATDWPGYPRDEQQKQWIERTHYNPHDHTANIAAKCDPSYDEGEILPFGNNDIAVDDADRGCHRRGTGWETPMFDPFRSFHVFPAGPESRHACWLPDLPASGWYDVYARFWSSVGRPDAVEYRVHHRNGEDAVVLDQSVAGASESESVWCQEHLGSYEFGRGEVDSVRLIGPAGAAVDELVFKLVSQTGGADQPPVERVTVRLSNVDDEATLRINDAIEYRAAWGHSGVVPTWTAIGQRPGDSGIIDVTRHLHPGVNTLRIILWNRQTCCWRSLTVEVVEGDDIVFQDSFRVRDSTEGVKYERTVEVVLP